MTEDEAVRATLRELDALLRVVAPVEHPPGASPVVLTAREVGFDSATVPDFRGFVVKGLDSYAAWLRRDDSLVGRPVVVVAVERILEDFSFFSKSWDRFRLEAAIEQARKTFLHEVAHAIAHAIKYRPTPPDWIDQETFPSWVRERFTAPDHEERQPELHGPDWWRAFVLLVARAHAIAPRVAPLDGFRADVERFGYGSPSMAGEWLAAVKTDADFRDAPLAELVVRPCAAFSAVLDRVRPSASETSSAAAAPLAAER